MRIFIFFYFSSIYSFLTFLAQKMEMVGEENFWENYLSNVFHSFFSTLVYINRVYFTDTFVLQNLF